MRITAIEPIRARSERRAAPAEESAPTSTVGTVIPALRPGPAFRRILAPIDFTSASLAVLEHAGFWAERCRATVHLLHVADEGSFANGLASVPLTKGGQEFADDARQRLATLARFALPAHLPATPLVRTGQPVREIMRAADALDSDLIVLGARRGGWWRRLFAGRTAARVPLRASCHVLTIQAPPDRPGDGEDLWEELDVAPQSRTTLAHGFVGAPVSACRVKHILVPIDFSASSKSALRKAVELAELVDARLTLLYVASRGYPRPERLAVELPFSESPMALSAEELLTRLAHEEVPAALSTRCLLRLGVPHHEIVETARAAGADLVVLGVHQRGSTPRLFADRTADAVRRAVHCPVLVVPHVAATGKSADRPLVSIRSAPAEPPAGLTWSCAIPAATAAEG